MLLHNRLSTFNTQQAVWLFVSLVWHYHLQKINKSSGAHFQMLFSKIFLFFDVPQYSNRLDYIKDTMSYLLFNTHTDTHTTILQPFFQDHPGEPVPEENFWTLWCKGRLTEADTSTIWLGATPSGTTSAHLYHSPIFYRPDALPAIQPTVSKQWRQLAHSD